MIVLLALASVAPAAAAAPLQHSTPLLARRLLLGGPPQAANATAPAGRNSTGSSSSSSSSSARPDAAPSIFDAPVLQLSGRASTLVYSTAIAAAAANATGDDAGSPAQPAAPRDPPPYNYPEVEKLPTVYFTAQVPGLASPADFTPAVVEAYLNAIRAFLKPAPGAPSALAPSAAEAAAQAAVLAVQPAAAGVWVPTAVAVAGDADGGLRALLAATLRSDANYVFPSAAWGVVKAVNVREALPTTPEPVAYRWVVGEYGECSALCGGGLQVS
jgi:hypothetical protein